MNKRNVFAIWISPEANDNLPEDIQTNIKAWKKYHPDYSFDVYSLDDCFSIIGNNIFGFPIKEMVETCRFIAMKSDVLRLALIYKIGGVYTDLKNKPVTSFLESLEQNKVYLCEHHPTENKPDPQGCFYNSFISSPPDSPLIKDIIVEVLTNIKNRQETGGVSGVSGSSAILRVLSRAKSNDKVYDFEGLSYREVWGKKMIRTAASYNATGHWSTLQKKESLYLHQL